MKKFSLLLMFFSMAVFAFAQNSNITFRVDMTDFLNGGGTIQAAGMHVAGSFQDDAGLGDGMTEWEPSLSSMTEMANNVWEYTLSIPNGMYEYKFVLDNTWDNGSESITGACGPGNSNRSLDVNGDATVEFCYNACTACGVTVPTSSVTLQVDMNNMITQFGTPSTVSVAGSFQGWTPGDTPMTDANSDGIYEVTVEIEQNTTQQYKFIFGDAWGYDEGIPSACSDGGNRSVNVGTSDMTVPTVCFGTCDASCPSLGNPINVTFQVDMNNEIVDAEGVHLTGTVQFPAWVKNELMMTDGDSDGIYEYTLSLYPREYQYKYVNGTTDDKEETADFITGGCGASNGIGGSNRVLDLTFTTQDTIVGHEYNTCDVLSNINEIFAAEIGIKITPNIAQTTATISFNNDNNESFDLFITDITGRIINQQNNITSNTDINVSNWSNGMYFISLKNSEGAIATRKLVVQQ